MRRVTGTHGTDTRCPHHCEKIQMPFKSPTEIKGTFGFPGLCVQSLYEYKRKDGACFGGDASKILPRFRL